MQSPFQNEVAGPQEWFGGGQSFGSGFSSFPSHPMAQGQMGGMFQGDGHGDSELNVENEPPLLEELGIDIDAVIQRIKAVAMLRPLEQRLVLEGDLTGPMLILGALMLALLLQGKVHFEQVYVLAVISWLSTYVLINLMTQHGGIDLYCAASMFGYGLLPVVVLAFLSVLFSFKSHGWIGSVVAILTVLWCTATSSKFVSSAISTQDQQWLIAYPIGLMYSAFVVVTVC